jgi:hypothetical protein
MMRIVQAGNALPFSFPVDPSAEFEPGQIAQLTLLGNQTVCGVSDGSAPIGIIDDIKKSSFTSVSIDEVVIAPVAGIPGPGGGLVAPLDVKVELNNPNVLASSFVSNPVDVELIPRNGVVTFLAGTPLNFSLSGSGAPDAIRTVVSYSYQVPNIPGDDSTFASGRITVWFMRMIYATDRYETNQRYPLNAPLFVNESGLLTTRQISADYPAIALVTGPPTSVMSMLEAVWL